MPNIVLDKLLKDIEEIYKFINLKKYVRKYPNRNNC